MINYIKGSYLDLKAFQVIIANPLIAIVNVWNLMLCVPNSGPAWCCCLDTRLNESYTLYIYMYI